MKKLNQGLNMLPINSQSRNFSSRISDGFTLVEMLIVMGIMSILIVVLSQVFGTILTMKLRSQATTAVAQDSRYILARLSYDIARASDITTPNSGSSGNSLTLSINGTNYVYSLSGTTLMLAVGGQPGVALSGSGTKINNLTFNRYSDLGGKKNVRANLTIASTIIQPGGVTGERQLTTTVATR